MPDVPTEPTPRHPGPRTYHRLGFALAAGTFLAGCVYYQRHIRPTLEDWGATRHERSARYPGDELVADGSTRATFAITIAAPRTDVWPWLVQMGMRRGGWYGVDLLDNGGCKSAIRSLPEFQQLEEGDVVPLDADGRNGFPVLKVRPERHLILGAPIQTATREPLHMPGTGPQLWAFHLEPRDDEHATRLIVRIVGDKTASPWTSGLPAPVPEAFALLMQRRQLRGIRQRAERLYRIHRAREQRADRVTTPS